MYVCVCRSLKESDFESEREMKERIMCNDFQCGQCQITYISEGNEDEEISTETLRSLHQT